MIAIGRLADYAGVTVKAIRPYHRLGLLAEPPRDSSGYRSYSSGGRADPRQDQDSGGGGVPLARVTDLLAADPDRFDMAIAEIDRTLRTRAADIARTRDRLVHLRAGDRMFLTPGVVGYLDRLRASGQTVE